MINHYVKKIGQMNFVLCNSINTNSSFENNLEKGMLTVLRKRHVQNKWRSGVMDKPKLRTFMKFKDIFNAEDYVKCNSRRKCSFLAQFSMGILPLAIETGRCKGIDEQYCKCYSNQLVDDEQYFLCMCIPLYDSLRNILIYYYNIFIHTLYFK